MWTAEILILIALVFLLAGMVKGLVGLGLPTVSLALLTATLGLKEAMALMLLPSLATNAWQALAGGGLRRIAERLWPLLLAACGGIVFGTALLAGSDGRLFAGLLGVMLCVYAAISLATPQVPPPGGKECWLSPVVGAANGVISGMTGSFVVPGVLYLQALGLPRDLLVQAMGLLFTVSTLALAASLGGHGLLPAELGLLSAGALVPAFAGMALGQRLRQRLPEQRFRKIFFLSLTLLGLYIAARAFG